MAVTRTPPPKWNPQIPIGRTDPQYPGAVFLSNEFARYLDALDAWLAQAHEELN